MKLVANFSVSDVGRVVYERNPDQFSHLPNSAVIPNSSLSVSIVVKGAAEVIDKRPSRSKTLALNLPTLLETSRTLSDMQE